MSSNVVTNALVLVLAFSSGFIIMSIELLGGRILAPYFGSGIYVWGSIITVFMLSLSIGYLIGGRLSVDNPNLFRYGTFFIGAATTLLPTIAFGEAMLDWVFGMIAPYSVRLMVEHARHSGKVAGGLYFVSTLGSALGTLATSFYLVLWLEVNNILLTMFGTLIAGGCIAIFSHYRLAPTPEPELVIEE